LGVRPGEILGIAGVSGNGQKELLALLSGEVTIREAAAIRLLGRDAGRLGAGARRDMGLCFVPEERLGRGAVPVMTLAENALLTAHRAGMVLHGLIRARLMNAFTRRCIEEFNVKSGGEKSEAQSLSGGNLQKFIVGRELLQHPRVLIVAQPTWGVDVGASVAIRQSLLDLRAAGAAILVVSEELDELFEISDRIAVIAKGRISPAVPVSETHPGEIGIWMSGMWDQARNTSGTGETAAGNVSDVSSHVSS
jgi:simple sugar transport system ATP-binding protein